MRLRSRPALIALLALAVVCVGWSILWHFVAGATQSALDDWMAGERQAGRVWTCRDRTVSGFPFQIDVRCAGPTFVGRFAGARVDGSVGDIVATAHAYAPHVIVAHVAPPLRIQTTPERGEASLNWRGLTALYQGHEGVFDLGTVSVEGPGLTLRAPGFDPIEIAAASVATSVAPNARDAASLDVGLTATDVVAPLANNFLGGDEPINAASSATITHVDALGRGGNIPPQEIWRRSGGQVHVVDFKATRGEISISGGGTLDIDAAHRPRGRLDITAAGVGPILEKFGLPSALLAIGGMFGAKTSNDAPLPPGAIQLPIVIDGGRPMIGPARLPFAFAPLY